MPPAASSQVAEPVAPSLPQQSARAARMYEMACPICQQTALTASKQPEGGVTAYVAPLAYCKVARALLLGLFCGFGSQQTETLTCFLLLPRAMVSCMCFVHVECIDDEIIWCLLDVNERYSSM
jgi:hypothetical protein